jgi:hypothetical protein
VPDETKSSAPKEEAQTYEADRLIAEAEPRFGVAPHVAAGAFEATQRKTHTIDQAKKLIADFQKQEVEVDNPITPQRFGAQGEEE